MLFAGKTKGYFFELTDSMMLIARTNGDPEATVVEEVRECASDDEAAWAEILQHFLPKKTSGAFIQAACAVYPERRILRRATIEPKRVKESAYLPDFVATQFRIEPDKYTLALLNAATGTDYDQGKAAEKDVIIAGLPSEDIIALQDQLLDQKVYPLRLELGSLALLGGLSDYLRVTDAKMPLLVLELGRDVTHSFIVSGDGVEASRPIQQGLESMVPVVQKELGLKDEESARKLFFSNAFDFTGLGPVLIRRLLKELQSSIGFHEVQTGQSIGHVLCVHLPPKLEWLEGVIAGQLGVAPLRLDLAPWLQARRITIADTVGATPVPARWLGLFSLMAKYDAVPAQKV